MTKEQALAEILGVEEAAELLDESVAALMAALRERGVRTISKVMRSDDMKRSKELTPTELEMVEQLAAEAAVEAVEGIIEETVDGVVEETVDETIAELTEESEYNPEDEEEKEADLEARIAAIEETLARLMATLEGEEKALRPRVVKRASAARETVVELSDLLPELKSWGQPRTTLFGRPVRGGVK